MPNTENSFWTSVLHRSILLFVVLPALVAAQITDQVIEPANQQQDEIASDSSDKPAVIEEVIVTIQRSLQDALNQKRNSNIRSGFHSPTLDIFDCS